MEQQIVGEPGEVYITVVVTRAETGKEETYELVGKVINELDKQENIDESNA
jgi:hypothetical protein